MTRPSSPPPGRGATSPFNVATELARGAARCFYIAGCIRPETVSGRGLGEAWRGPRWGSKHLFRRRRVAAPLIPLHVALPLRGKVKLV
jgi:hypothetical protein